MKDLLIKTIPKLAKVGWFLYFKTDKTEATWKGSNYIFYVTFYYRWSNGPRHIIRIELATTLQPERTFYTTTVNCAEEPEAYALLEKYFDEIEADLKEYNKQEQLRFIKWAAEV